MIKNKKIVIIIISLIVLCSCTPQQRINRILYKHPHLLKSSLDTLKITDTLRIENTIHDTTTIFNRVDSTIIINNEKIFAKYIFDTITKEIYHHIECKGDTIYYYKEVPFEVEKIIYQEKPNYYSYLIIVAIIFGLFVLLFFMKTLKDLFK